MTVPASSPVDDALDRLADEYVGRVLSEDEFVMADRALATVREELQRLREVRDALDRLASIGWLSPEEAQDLATVREALERLRANQRTGRIIHNGGRGVTGPLAPLFAQVREESALLADWAEEPLGMGSVDVDNVRGRLLEALSSIERYVQDMATKLTEQHSKLWLVGLDTHEGEEQQSEEDSVRNLRRLLAALPASGTGGGGAK